MITHTKDLHKSINIISLDDIQALVLQELDGLKNIELYDIQEVEVKEKNGLEFNLFDYLDKSSDFECDIENLLYILDKKLPERFIFNHSYTEETSISDLDGEEYPDYHCFVKIWKNK